jgi:hypothetical protein
MMQVTDVPGFGPPQLFILFLNILIIAFVGYLLVYWLHDRKTTISPDGSKERRLDPRTATIFLAVTALVSPISVNYYPHEVYGWTSNLMGMTWMMIHMNFWDIVIDPLILLSGLALTFMRIVFVYQIHLYLIGRASQKRTIIIGILSELQQIIMILPVYIILSLLGTFELVSSFFFIPIPVLLLVGLVIMRIVPTRKIESPWENA